MIITIIQTVRKQTYMQLTIGIIVLLSKKLNSKLRIMREQDVARVCVDGDISPYLCCL